MLWKADKTLRDRAVEMNVEQDFDLSWWCKLCVYGSNPVSCVTSWASFYVSSQSTGTFRRSSVCPQRPWVDTFIFDVTI